MTITAETTLVASIHLPAGMVGFPDARDYSLREIEPGVFEMLSEHNQEFGFVVIRPEPFFPDYSPAIDTTTAQRLELREADDALLLLVVNIGAEGDQPVANLLAPIVVNPRTLVATQVVLVDQDLPLRAPIPVG